MTTKKTTTRKRKRGPGSGRALRTGMTPEAFCTAIEKLGLTREAAGELLGFGARTGFRYGAGDAAIVPPARKILNLLLAGKVSIEDVEKA